MPFSDTEVRIQGSNKTIMSDEWTYIFEHWIKKAVESHPKKIKCKRSPLAPGNFIKGIVDDISESNITIADLTGGKPNVYYELGIRHALKNGTIIISQSFEDLPSDLKSYYCFEYMYTDLTHKYKKSFEEFEKNIHSYIDHIIENNFPSDNPVSDYLELDKFKDEEVENIKITNVFGPNTISINTSQGKTIVNLDEVLFLKADGSYSTLTLTTGETYLFSKPLNAILEEINNKWVKRVHKSYALNVRKIKRITRNKEAILTDRHPPIPISQPYRKYFEI